MQLPSLQAIEECELFSEIRNFTIPNTARSQTDSMTPAPSGQDPGSPIISRGPESPTPASVS